MAIVLPSCFLFSSEIWHIQSWPQLILTPNIYPYIIGHHSKLGRGQIKGLVLIQEYFLLFHFFLISHHEETIWIKGGEVICLLYIVMMK